VHKLKDKVTLITGVESGMERAQATIFANEGGKEADVGS
jgi:NAD(P)-dependent dehydrogenase (short-subunit alcohol dehydrogenase family)